MPAKEVGYIALWSFRSAPIQTFSFQLAIMPPAHDIVKQYAGVDGEKVGKEVGRISTHGNRAM